MADKAHSRQSTLSAAGDRKSSITYYDPYNVWPLIQQDFMAHLPLRNLHWKSANRPLRSIQSLQVEMRQYQHSAEEQLHQMPISLLEKPYLNIMLVQCEDNDTYRNTVRKTIREWYNGVLSKRNQEWMILHVIPKSSSGGKSSRFAVKGSVFDKIKADFNSSKKDRCAQLRSCDTEGEELEMWQDILGKIKDGVLQSFDSRVLHYEEDIHKMDSQRTLPGWNYCTFFILKEGLAQSFEHMLLLEDALIQYDELEASFFQMLRDKQLTWFTRTGGTAAGDDSANVLDLSHKDYRTLILANNISLFDFRVYLFARQAFLLNSMGQQADICARARDYIATLSRTLRNDREDAGISFIESWMFSAALQILEATSDAPRTQALAAARGDLYVIARTQLDKVGHYFRLIPESVPFQGLFHEVSLDEVPEKPMNNFKTTNETLKHALENETKFCELYETITSKAIEEFEHCNRTGSAESMRSDLASLYFHQKQYAKAAGLLEKLFQTSTDHGWNMVSYALMKMYAECLRITGNLKAHINILLKILVRRAELAPGDGKTYMDELNNNLTHFSSPLRYPLQNYFTLQIAARPTHRENEDGFVISAALTNLLPDTLSPITLKIKVTSVLTGQELWFSAPNISLPAGKSEIQTTCSVTAPGQYIFEKALLEWHSVVFMQEFVELGKKQYLNLYPHGNAMSLKAGLSKEIYLDRPKKLQVQISTGWNHIIKGEVTVSAPSGNVEFLFDETELEVSTAVDGEKTKLDIASKAPVEFGDVPSRSSVSLAIPFTADVEQTELQVKIEVKYTTSTGDYHYYDSCSVPLGLPLSVGVTDSFRPKLLVSIFAVHCAGSPLRILNVRLNSSNGFQVWTGSNEERDLICFPNSPAKFVYQIARSQKENLDADHPLTFVVAYRMVEKEINAVFQKVLARILREKGLERLAYRLSEAVSGLVKNVDLENYRLFNVIMLKDEDEWIEREFSDLSQEDQLAVQEVAGEFLRIFKDYEPSQEEMKNIPREIIFIPADVPAVDVVHTVSLTTRTQKGGFLFSRPIEADLSVYSSYNWNRGDASPSKAIECYYDIVADPDTWLISGCKRAQFAVEDDVKKTFSITLVPLKTGIVKIPRVEIEVLTPKIVSEVEDASMPDIVVLPTRFTAIYKVELPEIPSQ